MINLLDQETIDKIAAGEVVERPSSIVKELVENAIDSGSNAITVEIKDGGLSLIRVTDNGCGIEKNDIEKAFIRHATSKIIAVEDLLSIHSLGFRGEALASISAIAQVECISKTPHDITGIRYEIHGSKEIAKEEIGAPTGTTIIVRNMFYNVPARKKFLKTSATEGSYISDMLTRLALSHPEISFKYIMNGNNKIATSGNGKLQDVIFHLYGKDVANNLLPVKREVGEFKMEGYIGKSFVSKGNRSFEHYFINGRSIRSNIVNKAIEEGYKSFVMIHKFPFTALHITLDSTKLDVNIHPQKMEFKYSDNEQLFDFIKETVRQALLSKEMIQDVSLRSEKEERQILVEQQKAQTKNAPEPFENNARSLRYSQGIKNQIQSPSFVVKTNEKIVTQTNQVKDTKSSLVTQVSNANEEKAVPETEVVASKNTVSETDVVTNKNTVSETDVVASKNTVSETDVVASKNTVSETNVIADKNAVSETSAVADKNTDFETRTVDDASNLEDSKLLEEQLVLPVERFISKEARKSHRLIGQVFKTYWLIEYDEKLYVMDQHAAHEKVMFERLMKQMQDKNVISQQLLPAKVVHLDSVEHNTVMSSLDLFHQVGFEIEDFGDDSIVVRAVPDDIMGIDPELLFDELLYNLQEDIGKITMEFFVEKLSNMACKAAIKGNTTISYAEADELIDELLTLDNPYNCPHGRPTMFSFTKYELERKFKRIQDSK